MLPENLKILNVLSSRTCNDVVECLKKGRTHPDEIAADIGIKRQAVDVYLVNLYKLGLVDRGSTFPLKKKKPRLRYQLTERGIMLFKDVENLVERFREMLENDFHKAEEDLEVQLLDGKISEEIYRKRLAELKASYMRED
jgi:predicted transcriptional regulator